MIRVSVDTRKCQAYANCIVSAPEVFDIDEATGKVTVLDATPSPELRAAVEEAVRGCPTHAIAVEELGAASP